MKEDFGDWISLIGMLVVVAILLVLTAGCATVPSLSITEADIDAKIAELEKLEPSDPDAVVYDASQDRYVVKPDAYKRATGDGVIKLIQDDKIDEMNDYLTKNPPATFKDKLKWAGWGAVILLMLEVGAYFASGGF